MRTIAFYSQKGGTGKTTNCVNVAGALAAIGRRVLIVDLDGNACASRTFGRLVSGAESIAAALRGETALASVVARTQFPGLWLAPGSPDLRTLQFGGAADSARLDEAGLLRPEVLTQELGTLAADAYDYVLIDCPGGNPFMDHAALLACAEVIVPTGLAVYDLYAATPTLHLITLARRVRGDGRPEFVGFLPNGAGREGIPPRLQTKLDSYEAPYFSPVRYSATLKTIAGADRAGDRLVVLARPDNVAARSYRQVALEIEIGIEAGRALAAARCIGEESSLSSAGPVFKIHTPAASAVAELSQRERMAQRS